MPNDYRSPEQIERDIENERAGLTSSLDALTDRLSFDGVAGQVTDSFKTHASDIGQSVARVARENPVGLLITGVGLAWLAFGDRAKDKVREMRHDDDFDRPVPAERVYAERGVRPVPGRTAHASNAGVDYGAYPHRTASPRWAADRDWDDTDFELTTEDDDASPTFKDHIYSAVESAKDGIASAATAVRHGFHDATEAVSDAGNRAKWGVKYRTAMTRDAAKRMREQLAAGTENLSDEARNRVIAARERAIAARREAGVMARARGQQAADAYNSQPLVAGAVAIAVGAAIGALIPRTRTEDKYFGERSDALMARAEQIYLEEKAKATRVARATLDEAGQIAEEKRRAMEGAAPGEKSVGEALADEARTSAKRVADRAKTEAEKEDLGNPS